MMEIHGIYKVPNEPTPQQAFDFWKKQLKDKKFYNESIKKNIRVTKKGIEKCIHGRNVSLSTLRIQLIFLIEYLATTAIFVREEKDRKERNNLKIIIMKATVIINKQPHLITIRLRETPQGVLYYYHSEINVDKKG